MMNIEWLLEQGPCRKVNAGELVFYPASNRTEENKSMYILLSGAVDVYIKEDGGIKKVSSLVAGDVFGGKEYFLGVDDFSYRASEECMLYLLTEESFNDLSWSQPETLFEILRSAYMPDREPTPDKPVLPQKPAGAASTKPAAAASSHAQSSTAISGSIFPPGHKIYKGKDFPMNDKLVYPKEYTCPYCGKPFHDFRIFRSKLYESEPVRYDLRKFYDNFQYLWYDVITCSNCLFSMFSNYFTEPKPLKKSAIEEGLISARADVSIDFSAPRDINHVFTMHYLSLLCHAGFPTASKLLCAKLWVNISWLYEDIEDKEMEVYAATKAVEAFEDVFDEKHMTPIQDQYACVSIAAMQHKAGIDRNLMEYLNKAKSHMAGDKTYSRLAEELLSKLEGKDI